MSDDERTKKRDALVKGASVVASTTGLVPGAVASLVVGTAFDIFNRSNAKRVERLIEAARRGEDPEAFAERMEKALANEDSAVLNTFMQCIRTAFNAIDPVVMVSIGLLFRMALEPTLEPVPRWKLRRYLQLLEELSAEEFRDVRTLVHAALKAPSLLDEPDRDGVPVTSFRADERGWCEVHIALIGTAASLQPKLCVIQEPARIFEVLVSHKLASESDEWGISLSFDIIAPLAAVMPLPTAPAS